MHSFYYHLIFSIKNASSEEAHKLELEIFLELHQTNPKTIIPFHRERAGVPHRTRIFQPGSTSEDKWFRLSRVAFIARLLDGFFSRQ